MKYFIGIHMQERHTVYSVFKLDDKYVFLSMSIDEGMFRFINPRDEITSAVPAIVTMEIVPKFQELCLRLQRDCSSFKVENYNYRYSKLAIDENIHDGICIISVLYFCVMNIPIYYDVHSLIVARDNFCSWICIHQELPYYSTQILYHVFRVFFI